jgi:hypothetical protein
MDWSHFLSAIGGGAGVVMFHELRQWFQRPKWWNCPAPMCGFRASASHPDALELIKERHMTAHASS